MKVEGKRRGRAVGKRREREEDREETDGVLDRSGSPTTVFCVVGTRKTTDPSPLVLKPFCKDCFCLRFSPVLPD